MGLGEGARYILNYQKSQNPDLKFEIKTYQFTEYNVWLEDKVKQQELTSFPNLPYLKIHKSKNNYLGIKTGEDVNNSTVLITQSDAILRTMGMEFGLVGDSVEEQIKIDTVSGVLSDFFKGVLDRLFDGEKWKDITDFHEKQILNGACKQLDHHLGENKFVGGAKLSWCDFKMLHYMTIAAGLYARLRHSHENIDRFMREMVGDLSEGFREYYTDEFENRGIIPGLDVQAAFGRNFGWPDVAGKAIGKVDPVFKRKSKL